MKLGKIKYFILLFLMTFIFPLNVLAENLVSIKSDKDTLNAGDLVTVTAKITDDKKLYALNATLSYDKDVFTAIDTNDFTALNEWSNVIYNDSNNQFAMINKTGEILDNALTIHLKVKDDAKAGNTLITLNNISASDSKNKYEFDDSEVKTLITRDAKDNEVVPLNNELKSDKKVNKIIKVFTNRKSIITTSLLILMLIFVMILIDRSKVTDKKKLHILSICLTLVLIIILLSLNWRNYNKRDINKDDVLDYNDAKDIINYIIDIKNEDDLNNNINNRISKKKSSLSTLYSVLDLNNDGYVDVVDVAQSVENANKVDYKVDIKELLLDNYYILKNDKINLKFKATINPNEDIKKVVVNGDGLYFKNCSNSKN